MGVLGPHLGRGQYLENLDSFFCCLLFLTWGEWGVKPYLGTLNELPYSFGLFLAHPIIIGSQVSWTDRPGLCFTLGTIWSMG